MSSQIDEGDNLRESKDDINKLQWCKHSARERIVESVE